MSISAFTEAVTKITVMDFCFPLCFGAVRGVAQQ
jgi:hypothetical protein